MPSSRSFYLSAGVRAMIGSAFFFSLMSLLVKLAGRTLPSQEIVFVRGLVTLALSWAVLARSRHPMWGAPRDRSLLVARGVFGFLALSCFYYSLTTLPMAASTVIQYTSPVFTAVLAAVLLGERGGRLLAGSLALALIGVALVVRPGTGSDALPLVPAAIGFAGAMMSACAYICVRRLAGRAQPVVIIFYFPLIAVPASLPALFTGSFVMPRGREWLILLGIGVTTQIAQVLLTRGLSLEPAGRATAVSYLQVLFATLWGLLLFGERPDAWACAGGVLVLAGALAPSLVGAGPVAVAPAGLGGATEATHRR